MMLESENSADSRLSRDALALLPELAEQVDDRERSKALVCHGLFAAPHHLLRVGRFQLLRTLGRGGMGVVYEALDTLRHERIALKMLHRQGPAQLYELKREFRSLAGLSHPNLVALHDLYVGTDGAYFSMDLIHGRDFTQFALEADLAQLEHGLLQLATGLYALHAAGKLHRDLKPQNVLVTAAGRVVLLDFGLAAAAAAVSGSTAGTPAYMAPEQARGEPCESSDWFGFGAVLRLALDARLTAGRDRSLKLEQMAEQLTDPLPEHRPGFRAVEARLGGKGAARSQVTQCFVGREHALLQLDQALQESRHQPVLLLVRGESGIGKSALLQHFIRTRAAEVGALALCGRCYERESVPYKGLDGVMDALSQHLLATQHAQPLPAADARALLQVFPVFARVPALRRAAAGEPEAHAHELRTQAVRALRRILQLLAAERPLLLCIDDLQWSDADSGRLLAELLDDEQAPPLLVLCSDRNDPHSESPALAELRELGQSALQLSELELGPLAQAELQLLANALLHASEIGSAQALQLAAESRGSPLLACELAHFASVPHAAGLRVESLFEQRLRAHAPQVVRVLQLVAAAGRPVSTAVVARAAGLGEHAAHASAELHRARLLRAVLHEGGELLVLHHDRIAQVALGGLDPRQRRGLHARLARALQAIEGPSSDGLLEQYLAAGRTHHAARCALRAGRVALNVLAFSRAARLLVLALEHGTFQAAERSALERDLALALEHAGRPLEAAAALRRAADGCGDRFLAVQLRQRAAQHLVRDGQRQEGMRLLKHCYAQLGLRWPTGRLQLFMCILALLLRTRLPAGRARDASLDYARTELTGAIGTVLEQLDVLRAVYNTLLCLAYTARLPEPGNRLRIQGTYGLMRIAGLWPGGTAYGLRQLEAACDAASKLEDAAAECDLQRQLAFAYAFEGRPSAALEAARSCERQVRAQPLPALDRYELVAIVGYALYELGELHELQRCWRELMHEARMHGDPLIKLWVHVHPARLALLLAANDRDGARALLEQQTRLREQCPEQRGLAWARATCAVEEALYWGEWQRAEALLNAERAALFGSGYPFLTRWARELRARCSLTAAASLSGRERTRHLRAAASQSALLQPRGIHAARVSLLAAQLAAARGQHAQALSALERASPVLERERAKLLGASAQYFRGALLGGEQGCSLQRQAELAMRAQGVRDPLRWAQWSLPGFIGHGAARE